MLLLLNCFSCVQLCATLWTVAFQASSVHVILQTGMLERVAMPTPGESFQPRDQAHVSYISCIDRQVLYH